MNLIVFTPASVRSAIGRMAALVTRELVALGCQVTVVRTEAQRLLSTDMHDFGATVLAWDDEASVLALVQSADACVYQIGNSFEFHEGGVRWLADFPGLVCLHDFFLGHLFYGWAQTHRVQAESVLQNWYGKEMAKRFFSFSDSESFIEGTREFMPMTEWICSRAEGVITHSQWGCDRVLNSCSGPVRVASLPYDAPGAINSPFDRRSTDGGTLKLLTIGHANPNKRIASVIQAIGLSPLLRQRIKYRLVGAIQPDAMESLSALAAHLGVNLLISGEVDDSELNRAINESDVISCIRWPVLEAASASAIEAMLYGKVVIVTDAGFYADIPESCAIKINHSNEIVELQSSLISLLEDQSRVVSLGAAAQNWAAKTFTAKNYAEQVMEIILDVSRSAPAIKAINYFCQTLRQWSYRDNPVVMAELTHQLHIFEQNGTP